MVQKLIIGLTLSFTLATAIFYFKPTLLASQHIRIPEPKIISKKQGSFKQVCGNSPSYEEIFKAENDAEIRAKLGIPSADYIKDNAPSNVLLQWKSHEEMRKIFKVPYNLGNVASEEWCTGTLIKNEFVLTAAHCFKKRKIEDREEFVTPYLVNENGKEEYAAPKQLAKAFNVVFNYQLLADGSSSIDEKVSVVELVEDGFDGALASELDYAILKIQKPSSSYSPARLELASPQTFKKLVIFQHPEGKEKKVETGTLFKHIDEFILYNDIDTAGGSSGASVRNLSGKVAGVHFFGGCQATVEINNKKIKANVATSIEAIIKVSKTLQKIK